MIIKHLVNISPSLERFQRLIQTLFPKVRFPGLTRVSLGIENSEEDVDRLIHVLGEIAGHARSSADKHYTSIHNGTSILPKSDVQRQINDFTKALAQRVYSQL